MTLPILLSRSEINDARWNELIAKSGQSVIYGFSWYLDIVCDNWKALVWPSTDNYQIVMPLPIKRKWNIEVVQQPLFCQYLGLFSIENLTDQQLDLFLKGLSSSFSYISAYHFNPDNSSLLQNVLHQFSKFEVRQNHTFWLSLSGSSSEIWAKYSSDRKANLKRGVRFEWVISPGEDIELLIHLFKEHHASGINGGVSDKAYTMLSDMVASLKLRDAIEVLYAQIGGTVHAGVLFVRTGNKVIFLFNAADEIGRRGNARTILLDHYFQSNSERPITFDFESPQLKSIASFYKSFGADPIPYFSVRKNDLPFPLKQIQNWRVRKLINTIEAPSEDSSQI
ncbi:GNAT family N-acetyltransferase [Dyadobacter subterraneus]|uniref:GNAT family N-acetyltransferase n=1 Tax=Dyadobacter subterraneus TaxID=2773304 RepID=A0ABR9WF48_9BACT|nr:GNAT family N-acetyltransferase [Dyadobacter subterraneus]MBE9464120.1 GNAT family N-acetyltransferase [Dyadobacter subterraneus]